ncbi:hypothetical protein PsYK624_170510 [Phanerochaete sordida]|uniref:Uncharacterized protein n=1 Tax=Phanerochaete sordida TaxID=48140 RepID=A0A9P3LP06_9APHY|nr:hypothetical protein PsYK624_170510 [Phanerochaete sordida]
MREAAPRYYQAALSPTTDPLKPLEMYYTRQSHLEDVPDQTLYLDFDERDSARYRCRTSHARASVAGRCRRPLRKTRR